MGFFQNKEVKVWNPIFERKVDLDLESPEINFVRQFDNYIIVSENISFGIF